MTLPISSAGSKQPADLPGPASLQGKQKGLCSVAQCCYPHIPPQAYPTFPGVTATAQSHRSVELQGTKAIIMSGGFQTLFVKS